MSTVSVSTKAPKTFFESWWRLCTELTVVRKCHFRRVLKDLINISEEIPLNRRRVYALTMSPGIDQLILWVVPKFSVYGSSEVKGPGGPTLLILKTIIIPNLVSQKFEVLFQQGKKRLILD